MPALCTNSDVKKLAKLGASFVSRCFPGRRTHLSALAGKIPDVIAR